MSAQHLAPLPDPQPVPLDTSTAGGQQPRPTRLIVTRAPASEPVSEPHRSGHLYAVPDLPTQLRLPEIRPEYVRRDTDLQMIEAQIPGALERYFGPQSTPSSRLPAAGTVARTYCQAVVEVLTGYRPIEQLRPHSSAEVFAWIDSARVRRTTGRHASVPRISALRICEPSDGVIEASAVVRRSGRARAMAARFAGIDGEWRCVRLEVA